MCDAKCPFFPQEKGEIEVVREWKEDGVKRRKVIRRCLYDNSVITSFERECPREKNQKNP